MTEADQPPVDPEFRSSTPAPAIVPTDQIEESLRQRRVWVESKGQDVTPASFHRAVLTDAYFQGADLRGADFSQAILQGVELQNANLFRANFAQANLKGAQFTTGEASRGRLLRGAPY